MGFKKWITKKENLHKLILAIPALFVVSVLILFRQSTYALILIVFDLLGVIVGTWWLKASKKIALRIRSSIRLNLDRLHGLIISIPGLVTTAILYFIGQFYLSLLVFGLNMIGMLGGPWWLKVSEKITDKVHRKIKRK